MAISQYGNLLKTLGRSRSLYTCAFVIKALIRRKLFGTRRNRYVTRQSRMLHFKEIQFLPYEDMIGIYKEIFPGRFLTYHNSFIPLPGDVVFDVGAGEGFYTILIKKLQPGATVYAFEPFPDITEVFRHHLKINRVDGVRVVPVALFDRPGTATYFFDHDYGNGFVSSSSEITRVQMKERNFSATDPEQVQKVPITMDTLENFVRTNHIERIDILKVDVEGAEAEVIRGCGSALQKVQKIVLEYHSKELRQDVFEVLTSSGFYRLETPTSTIHAIDYFVRQ